MPGAATALPPPDPKNAVAECIALEVILRVLAYSTVGLRFWARRKAGSHYWWDDWLILVAAVSDRVRGVELGLMERKSGLHIPIYHS